MEVRFNEEIGPYFNPYKVLRQWGSLSTRHDGVVKWILER